MISDYREEETPVPIPNTEVKLFFADDSPWATVCESRALLILIKNLVRETCRGFLFFRVVILPRQICLTKYIKEQQRP